jgi:hypothetical protein
MANPWFRMYAEFASDSKVQMMPEAMQRRLVMLFCMRCSDVTVTLSDEEIAFHLRISDSELASTKELFLRKGFIDSDWNLVNWDKRQSSSDSSAARTRAYRERMKEVTVTSHVTECDALDKKRIEENREEAKAKEANASSSADAPPTCPHQKIIALYHEHMPLNPRIKSWEGSRMTNLQARWRSDAKRQTLDYWERFFKHCAKSAFLTGQTEGRGDRPFLPSLEWIVKQGNFMKIIEGNYHPRAPQ